MKKEFDAEIGLRVRRQREALGYSREKLAENAGMAVSFLASIERGKCDFTVTTLKKLCTALGVSPDILLFGKEQGAEAGEITSMLSGLDTRYFPLAREMLSAFLKTVFLAEHEQA